MIPTIIRGSIETWSKDINVCTCRAKGCCLAKIPFYFIKIPSVRTRFGRGGSLVIMGLRWPWRVFDCFFIHLRCSTFWQILTYRPPRALADSYFFRPRVHTKSYLSILKFHWIWVWNYKLRYLYHVSRTDWVDAIIWSIWCFIELQLE